METGLEREERSEAFAEIPEKEWKPELRVSLTGIKGYIKRVWGKRGVAAHRDLGVSNI